MAYQIQSNQVKTKSEIFEELSYLFDNKTEIKAVESGRVLNLAVGTIRNRIIAGDFPVRVITVKSLKSNQKNHVRHFVKVADLADYLYRRENNLLDPARVLKKRGRPTKAEQKQKQFNQLVHKNQNSTRPPNPFFS